MQLLNSTCLIKSAYRLYMNLITLVYVDSLLYIYIYIYKYIIVITNTFKYKCAFFICINRGILMYYTLFCAYDIVIIGDMSLTVHTASY